MKIKYRKLSRRAVSGSPAARVDNVRRLPVVVIAGVVVRVAVEWPPSDEIHWIYGRAADALLIEGLDLACRKRGVVDLDVGD